MSQRLFNLGRRCARHPFRVLGLWLVAAIVIFGLQGAVGGPFNDNFRVPGVESQTAADILSARFPSRAGVSGRVVFHSTSRPLTDPRAHIRPSPGPAGRCRWARRHRRLGSVRRRDSRDDRRRPHRICRR